jgi:ferredoxin-NADP reductase
MAVAQKLRCVVDRIVAHGDQVYSLELRPERKAPAFRPGQFLHLTLEPYDPSGFWPESRPFSIASSPAERAMLRITYAVHGRFTRRMETDLVQGRQVWIKMPYGDFVIDRHTDVALFAGGTGITAFTAFLEDLMPETDQSVVLAYGSRNRPLLIYQDAIERCAARLPLLDVVYFVEEGGDAMPAMHPGRVSVNPVWARLRQPLRTMYYIAGPPPMLQAIAADLRARQVPAEAIHIDAWE